MIAIDDATEIMERVRATLEADRVGPGQHGNVLCIGLERYAFACAYCKAVYHPQCQPFVKRHYGRVSGKRRNCQRRALRQELADAEQELAEWFGGPIP